VKGLKGKVLVSVGKANFPDDVANILRPLAEVFYISPSDPGYNEVLEGFDAVIVSMETIDKEYISRAPRLGIIARFGVGYDNVDVVACSRRGIHVTHTPGVLSAAVADLTWGLILTLTRRIVEADRFAREEWAKRISKLPFRSDLEEKTIGIIGLGRIGLEVARRAQGFGAKLIYHDVVRRPDLEAGFNVEYVEFDKLLREADVISLHVPLLPSTRHLIGRRELSLMKPTALLINTSRGAVVDQEALVVALEEGRIGGAGLDVFEEEPLPLGDRLAGLRNVVLTPHIGSATVETRRKMATVCAENVRAFLEGKMPPNLVPEQRI
jgi:glyoxylate reductase